MKWLVVCALLAPMFACSSLVNVSVYPDAALPPRGPGCPIALAGEFTEYPDSCVELGVMTYRAPLLALGCDAATPRSLAREKGCEVGATHVRVRWTEICSWYRAEFFACPLVSEPPPPVSPRANEGDPI